VANHCVSQPENLLEQTMIKTSNDNENKGEQLLTMNKDIK
jgi:hypothetical protein